MLQHCEGVELLMVLTCIFALLVKYS
jgi:hypothetical protein